MFKHGAGWILVAKAKSRPLYRRETNPLPLVQEAGWPRGSVWTDAENLAPTGIRSPDRPTSSESLYRLHSFMYFHQNKVNVSRKASERPQTPHLGPHGCWDRRV
jgi:hypothetical protein